MITSGASSDGAARWALQLPSTLRPILAVCLLLAAPLTSSALNPRTLISQYASDHWRTRDGLPQATVGAIAQTKDGYIWLATEEGLVRFDGVRFTVFDTTNSALTDNYISGLSARTRRLVVGAHPGNAVPLPLRSARSRFASGSSIGLDFSPMLEDRVGGDLEQRRGRRHRVRAERRVLAPCARFGRRWCAGNRASRERATAASSSGRAAA